MKRVAVDIGGTFTDCFVAWEEQRVEAKALTTHHNLALGFNEALDLACREIGIGRDELLANVDSVRYATTLGTNALIERKGPRLGLLVTRGFESTVAISRGRGYGDGLTLFEQMDVTNAKRPDPLVDPECVRGIRQRIGWAGDVLIDLDEEDVRERIRELVAAGVEALVISTANGTANPVHEWRVREIFLEEYPRSQLGAVPTILASEVSGRRGEYVRTSSALVNAYLHSIMFHAMGRLERNLRDAGYAKPMLVVHNSGGMAQLNSTDALQTVHSGPIAGIHAAEQLALDGDVGNVVTADMGGTSFDIGIVVKGGIKFYDFNPVVDRFLVALPMVHLASLGSGGGSIARYDSTYSTVRVGPDSAGSDPGPACYDRGGTSPTVTDADLVLGYLDPENYAHGRLVLDAKRSLYAFEDLCDDLGMEVGDVALLVRRRADTDMAIGISHELASRGFRPRDFTLLAYGGNGPLHACGIAEAAGIERVLVPPLASVFAAWGAGTLEQMHIHEHNHLTDLYNPYTREVFEDYATFNEIVTRLEDRGRQDLLRQGFRADQVRHRLELDIRYGTQMVDTAIECEQSRIGSLSDVLAIIERHAADFAERYGEASRSPESGVRVTTYRVISWVEGSVAGFGRLEPGSARPVVPPVVSTRSCRFADGSGAVETAVYDHRALEPGVVLEGPAIVNPGSTTYLVAPGWRFESVQHGAVWLTRRIDA